MRFIQLLVTALFLLTGVCCRAEGCVVEKDPDPSVTIPDPPKGHPRLYLGSKDIPALKARIESPQGQKIMRALAKLGEDRTPAEEAAETDRGFRYYQKMRGLTSRVQLDALNYLVYGDEPAARRAISGMLDSLRHTCFGTQNDLSRASGIMLMVGAVVYDWCYDRFTPQERQQYIDEFVRIAGTMECGYPPKRNEYLAGHGSEWMILRDMLSAGIAVYDEYPDMYGYVRQMLQEDYIPIRNYTYKGLNYHQGTSYANVRLSNDFISLWILDRMGAKGLYVPEMRQVLYDFIYRRRPDGKVLPSGDTNHIRGSKDSYPIPMMLASSYWHDAYLAGEWEIKPSMEPHCLLLQLLWQDFDLKGRGPEGLPLSRFSPAPYGWMIARTGWGDDSVIAEMKVNEQFYGNHQHLDGGAFQIYYKGPLAIDSGIYQTVEGGYNSLNNKCYTKRTIAHNSLLIHDPDEVFECYNYGGADKTPTAANDGGQRLVGKGWDTCRSFEDLLSEEYTVGKTLAHGFGPSKDRPEFTWLKGDITQAYSSKVSSVIRSFVFMNLKDKHIPAALVVYDRVVSSNPSFRKTWLLHSIEEPDIDGDCFTVSRTADGDRGMLRCDCLLPEGLTITKVGGPGKEFLVDGVNYPATPQPNRPDVAGERGAWRVEVSPGAPALQDCFLNVMQMADNDCGSFHGITRLEGDRVCGIMLAGRGVLFNKELQVLDGTFSFSLPEKCMLLMTDLAPGRWKAVCGGKTIKKKMKVSPDGQTLCFEVPAGTITMIKESSK